MREKKKAITLLNSFIKTNPKDATGFFTRGQAYVAMRDYPHGISDLSKALELDSNDPSKYVDLANACFKSGKYDRSLQVLTSGIGKSSDPDICMYERAKIFLAHDRNSEAMADFDSIVSKHLAALVSLEKKGGSPIELISKRGEHDTATKGWWIRRPRLSEQPSNEGCDSI